MSPPVPESRSRPAIAVVPAAPGDLAGLRHLLQASGLPVDGVGQPGLEFLVARCGGELVGCAAVEPYGAAALLRSLAVTVARRGQGIGDLLLRAVVDHARGNGARDLYALTTTIETLLLRRGFERIDRSEVPQAVRTSVEFESACPKSAACMRLAGELRPKAARGSSASPAR